MFRDFLKQGKLDSSAKPAMFDSQKVPVMCWSTEIAARQLALDMLCRLDAAFYNGGLMTSCKWGMSFFLPGLIRLFID